MSVTETPRAPEGADHHEDTRYEESGHNGSTREAELTAAVEAARRQARQDPLQG